MVVQWCVLLQETTLYRKCNSNMLKLFKYAKCYLHHLSISDIVIAKKVWMLPSGRQQIFDIVNEMAADDLSGQRTKTEEDMTRISWNSPVSALEELRFRSVPCTVYQRVNYWHLCDQSPSPVVRLLLEETGNGEIHVSSNWVGLLQHTTARARCQQRSVLDAWPYDFRGRITLIG